MFKKYDFFKKSIKVVAHRGDSGNFPENSKPAFESAVELGVDIIETDVHISSDGVIFVWHDEDTSQIDGNKDPLYNRSWSELSKLDVGSIFIDKDGKRPFANKGIGLMKFDDVLRDFPDIRFNVDLKDRKDNLVNGFYELLKKHDAFNRVIVASFSVKNIKMIRKLSSKVITSFTHSEIVWSFVLCKVKPLRPLSHLVFKAPVIQCPVGTKLFKVVTKKYIDFIHKNRVLIQPWTINNKIEMEQLYKLGVDGIMTDQPKLLIQVRDKLFKEVIQDKTFTC